MRIIISHLLTIAGFLLALLFIVRLTRENRHPGSTMAWLMAIILIPYIGIPFYFLFGGRKAKYLINKKNDIYSSLSHDDLQKRNYKYNVERILVKGGGAPAFDGNYLEHFSSGEMAYAKIMEMLEKAEHSIDITAFILGNDEVGKSIVDILIKKAQEGVKVRLILDSLGCMRTKGRFVDPLRDAGGRIGIFMPMLPFHRKWSAHLRNHRKMIIIDHRMAVIGGMNFASQYMGPSPDKKRWRDFDILIKGPLVSECCKIFSADWHFSTGGEYKNCCWDQDDYSPHNHDRSVTAQIAASGPDVPHNALSDAILTALVEAKERIWIITPYFIPDESLLKSLVLLAGWGRDIRLILPSKSNHILADLARGFYLRTLMENEVKIHFFDAGMLHSKIILIDDSIAIVGSANMDIRSFYLNYEIALFIYSAYQVNSIAHIIQRDIFPLTHIMQKKRASLRRDIKEWMEDISRVLSPFL
ncbi:MAG: cardiolipin synthase [bacterium]